jgi:hypothetical protein
MVRARPLVVLGEAVSAVAASRGCARRCGVANGSCRDGQTGQEDKEQKPSHVLIFPGIPDEGNNKSGLTGGELLLHLGQLDFDPRQGFRGRA